jgi:putative ABC transport system substrate-binding protein
MRFVLAVALAALVAAAPLPGAAQQVSAKIPRVGILSPAGSPATKVFDGFRKGLRELGYVDGENITIEYRLAAGDFGRLPAMAADLVRMPVDVIITDGGDKVTQFALEATQTIPIVMATGGGDPVATGFAASFPHPGGNVTGFTLHPAELGGKWLQLLKEAFPAVSRAAVLWNRGSGSAMSMFQAIEEAARTLGVQLRPIEIASPEAIAVGFETATTGSAEALVILPNILPNAMFWNQRARFVALAAKNRMPAIYPEREYADDGGLLAYGANVPDNFRRAAGYVDKILKGAKPGDLPIQRPVKFEFLVNLKTANALGLSIPPSILDLADDVIE